MPVLLFTLLCKLVQLFGPFPQIFDLDLILQRRSINERARIVVVGAYGMLRWVKGFLARYKESGSLGNKCQETWSNHGEEIEVVVGVDVRGRTMGSQRS